MTEDELVEMSQLRPIQLSDLLDHYRIEEPIDDAADREQWQDIAARDVLGADFQRDYPGALPDPAAQSSSDDL